MSEGREERDVPSKNEWTRRSFLGGAVAAAGSGALAHVSAAAEGVQAEAHVTGGAGKGSSALEVARVPDTVAVYTGFEKTMPVGRRALVRSGDRWAAGDVVVESRVEQGVLWFSLEAPKTAVAVVHVRWGMTIGTGLRVLGDAWERSYGELGWSEMRPERVLPWYFATHDGAGQDGGVCHGYGVRTDARALCFWQVDPEGVSLWLNVANGGNGVELGERRLAMASVVERAGVAGEDAMTAAAGLCRMLCARPTRNPGPVYGFNDWCYSYGHSTAETILRDTEFLVGLAPVGGVRPFSVIDGGWSEGTAAWPDMRALAGKIKGSSARPGIWIRPLEAPRGTAEGLLITGKRFGERSGRAIELAYDPTVPEAREKIGAKVRQARGWRYELVKHDFSTYDLLGQWGFEMGPQPTVPGWSLADRSKTNAEVIAELYALLREAAGESMVLEGCNTVGHLGQGVFEMQRTGDDTSGHQWERTRRMGVNTLAFRLPQHGTFFTLDADLVGITEAVRWEFNRQWLEVLARSGTATIVSAGPPARGAEQRAALKVAFAMAAAGGDGARPVDWLGSSAPEVWRGRGGDVRYRWSGTEGASAFLAP